MSYKYLKNVSTLRLNSEKCIGCGMCANVCPHNVLFIEDKKSHIKDKDKCMECGACARNCPFSAITVESGVGCATAVLNGLLRKSKPCCGSGRIGEKKKGCC